MKTLTLVRVVIALLALVMATPLPVPAQIMNPLSSGSGTRAGENTQLIERGHDRHERRMQALWYGTMLAVAAGTSFDAASSWHKQEANPILASSNGTFGERAVGIKVGLTAAILLPQLLLRRHKEMRTGFIIGNMAEASIFTGVAIHNLTLPKR